MSLNEDEDSELIFGWIDHTKYIGEMKWYNVVHKYFWSIKLDDIKLNGTSLGLCHKKECLITPDSGTSTMTFPTWAWNQISYKFPTYNKC